MALVAALALLTSLGHTLWTMGAARARSAGAAAATALVNGAMLLLLAYVLGHVLRWIYNDSQTDQVVGPGVYFAKPAPFLSLLPLGLLSGMLVCGATVERARVRGIVIISAALAVVVLPVVTAVGWSAISTFDHRRADGTYGATATLSALTRIWPGIAAHLLAGGGALAAARAIGPRVGKYNRDGSANSIPAHSLPIVIVGAALLTIGVPMVAAAIAGDPAARMANALLAAAAGAMAGVAIEWRRHGRIDAAGPWGAALAGLVAGSLGSPVEPFAAIVLGAIVGAIEPIARLKFDLRFRIDEPSGLAIPHLLGGLAGAIGATLGAAIEGGVNAGEVALLVSIGFSAALAVAIVGSVVAFVVAMVVRKAGLLRVSAAEESEGLDLSRHDVNAYPDFQQTLIKSYHLRQ